MVRTVPSHLIPETRIFPTGGDPFSAQQGKTETPPMPGGTGSHEQTPTLTSSSSVCHQLARSCPVQILPQINDNLRLEDVWESDGGRPRSQVSEQLEWTRSNNWNTPPNNALWSCPCEFFPKDL